MATTLQFFGAAGTVTGSKYHLTTENKDTFLIDAGLFQGPREWREKNWSTPNFNIKAVKATLVTHAHIDHIGYLPRLVKLGLNCPVYMTHASKALAELLLIDSAKLQEEEAEFREQHGKSSHNPPQPLYNVKDAEAALRLIEGVDFNRDYDIASLKNIRWSKAGHILGAAAISLVSEDKKLQFSGDVGRYNVPIMPDPEPITYGDLLLIESTYGNRRHSKTDPKQALAEVINRTYDRRGMVLIPSFAVGRTQELLFYLRELKEEGAIPDLPIIVDSPMAGDATKIYAQHPECYDKESVKQALKGEQIFRPDKIHFVRARVESIQLNKIEEPMVLISASGMLSGGRVLHHVKHRIADGRNTLLFVGYQPEGGKGDWIKKGASTVRLFGDDVPIRAEIADISSLSAHGDCDELIRWCKSGVGKPKKVGVVHGEPSQAMSFAERLKKELGWNCFIAKYQELLTV